MAVSVPTEVIEAARKSNEAAVRQLLVLVWKLRDFVMHRCGQGVAIMTDSDNGPLFAMDPKEYARFVGTYDFGFGLKVTVERRNGALYSIADRRIWHRSTQDWATTFSMLEQNVDITFTSYNSSGRRPPSRKLQRFRAKVAPAPGRPATHLLFTRMIGYNRNSFGLWLAFNGNHGGQN